MPQSIALTELKRSLQMPQKLIDIERTYPDPPSISDRPTCEGLRGGALVLVVACLELFLREVVKEHIGGLVLQIEAGHFDSLPRGMQVQTVFATIEVAMSSPRYGPSNQKHERIPSILDACTRVLTRKVNADVFGDTSSNPSAETVKQLLKNVGIQDPFRVLKASFEAFKRPVAETFLQDKLNEIVDRRHVIAHTGVASNLTRATLDEYVEFIGDFAEIADVVLEDYFERTCRAILTP